LVLDPFSWSAFSSLFSHPLAPLLLHVADRWQEPIVSFFRLSLGCSQNRSVWGFSLGPVKWWSWWVIRQVALTTHLSFDGDADAGFSASDKRATFIYGVLTQGAPSQKTKSKVKWKNKKQPHLGQRRKPRHSRHFKVSN